MCGTNDLQLHILHGPRGELGVGMMLDLGSAHGVGGKR